MDRSSPRLIFIIFTSIQKLLSDSYICFKDICKIVYIMCTCPPLACNFNFCVSNKDFPETEQIVLLFRIIYKYNIFVQVFVQQVKILIYLSIFTVIKIGLYFLQI